MIWLITPEGCDWNHAWTQFWDLPEGLLLNLVPMQNYSMTPTALTQLFDMWWFLLADWNTS